MINSSGKTLTVLIGGVVIVTLLAFLALSGVAATFAWMAGWRIREWPGSLPDGHTWDEYLHACYDTHTWWKHLSLRASERDRCAGRGLGASDGQRAVRESSLWRAHQLPGLLLHLVQGTWCSYLHLACPPSRRR